MEKDLTFCCRQARELLARVCGVYPVCDGDLDHLCTEQKYGAPIGLGGAGQAKTFEANAFLFARDSGILDHLNKRR